MASSKQVDIWTHAMLKDNMCIRPIDKCQAHWEFKINEPQNSGGSCQARERWVIDMIWCVDHLGKLLRAMTNVLK